MNIQLYAPYITDAHARLVGYYINKWYKVNPERLIILQKSYKLSPSPFANTLICQSSEASVPPKSDDTDLDITNANLKALLDSQP